MYHLNNTYISLYRMLYLTYNNTDHPDGAGSQLQRMLSIYMMAKYFSIELNTPIGYIHTPLGQIDYQGLMCLEDNTANNEVIEEYNTLFKLPSDTYDTIHKIETVKSLSKEHILALYKSTTNILLRTTYADKCLDVNKKAFNIPIELPWITSTISYPIHVAIHVRRGELYVVDSDRMLPNSYYVECMSALQELFNNAGIPFEFHIYTEVIRKPTIITPTHHGIFNRISQAIILSPDDNKLEDFNMFNVIYHINESPIKTLCDLTNSHVLLASRSSFSYVSSILKKRGVVLFHPFWHGLSDSWIPVYNKNDILKHSNIILNSITRDAYA